MAASTSIVPSLQRRSASSAEIAFHQMFAILATAASDSSDLMQGPISTIGSRLILLRLPLLYQLSCGGTGLMLLGSSMLATGVPLVLTAGVTGALPGGSRHYSSSTQAGGDPISLGRVLLSEGGAAAPDAGGSKKASGQSCWFLGLDMEHVLLELDM